LQCFDREGFAAFTDEWMAAEVMTGKQASVKTINETATGKVMGINAQGHLLLKTADGKVRAFSSGDTTIIKK
jgi:BirA family biotin operon repressor/biotin-[acetyl-CoA-carboxylase] ligase